jgi:hypothetical protein
MKEWYDDRELHQIGERLAQNDNRIKVLYNPSPVFVENGMIGGAAIGGVLAILASPLILVTAWERFFSRLAETTILLIFANLCFVTIWCVVSCSTCGMIGALLGRIVYLLRREHLARPPEDGWPYAHRN